MKSFFFLLLTAFLAINASAQNSPDSLSIALPEKDTSKISAPVKKPVPRVLKKAPPRKADSSGIINPALIKTTPDSVIKLPPAITPEKKRLSYITVLKNHPYYNFLAKPRHQITFKRLDSIKDGLFYLLTAVVFYFAIIRLLFRKYMKNLFAVFFRVSLKQKQIREQLLQSPLPSLLLNIFFIISGGIYISFLLGYYKFVAANNLWSLMLFCTIALGIIYLGKFMMLKLMGWIFNITEATDTYNFVVFLVNKLLGIFLIPFLVLLAFSDAGFVDILVTLSFTMIAILFAYRYIISYSPVRKEIKVSQFHFFLYLCAFEIAPLLLIYKLLLTFLERST